MAPPALKEHERNLCRDGDGDSDSDGDEEGYDEISKISEKV